MNYITPCKRKNVAFEVKLTDLAHGIYLAVTRTTSSKGQLQKKLMARALTCSDLGGEGLGPPTFWV